MKMLVLSYLLACFCSLFAQEPASIYGAHDPAGAATLNSQGVQGWVVVTEEIGRNPNQDGGGNYTDMSNDGHGVIVRLNHGYGSNGTLPYESEYDNFAARAANFVRDSVGANIFIIGNDGLVCSALGAFFSDGFESGDLTQWEQQSP